MLVNAPDLFAMGQIMHLLIRKLTVAHNLHSNASMSGGPIFNQIGPSRIVSDFGWILAKQVKDIATSELEVPKGNAVA
ncbi:hypothetical protein [uncultured Roseovarius sp.]|uniref:hypothetical protein n=1 Tax=uncultured Roseovarius sp. TaxID=293344 RepID=UPI00263969F4|nr:hypothetical protein [uncultured Roseovarius sp.]